jgi:uncharacterized protein YkwD/LysM repeat protein
MRKIALIGLILALGLIAAAPVPSPRRGPSLSTAYELIDAVNALRAAYGLAPYTTNGILMGTAQGQAEYMASIGSWTHYGPDGSTPSQRAQAAGYPVAGDLSLGGWFSENVIYGMDLTAAQAVQSWTGDAPHLTTMISKTLRDIGAGVAVVDNTYYYVIDCGLSTDSSVVVATPVTKSTPNLTPPVPTSTRYGAPTATILPSTPHEDGSVIHVVEKGDTLYGIAFAYGVPLKDLLALNNLTANSMIYIGQKIIVHAAFTATATLPTSTPTHFPTATPWPTSTATSTASPPPPPTATATKSPGLPSSAAGGAVILIIIAAAIVAGAISLIGKRKKE